MTKINYKFSICHCQSKLIGLDLENQDRLVKVKTERDDAREYETPLHRHKTSNIDFYRKVQYGQKK